MTGAIVGQANGIPLKATHNSHLVILRKPPAYARKSTKLTGLVKNLLGLDPSCDTGCTLTLDKYVADVKFEENMVLTGWRDSMNGLRRYNLLPPLEYQLRKHNEPCTPTTNGAYDNSTTSELIGCLHAATFNPVPIYIDHHYHFFFSNTGWD